jgi:hypothetical protein
MKIANQCVATGEGIDKLWLPNPGCAERSDVDEGLPRVGQRQAVDLADIALTADEIPASRVIRHGLDYAFE